jgi:Ca2+-transporting ATPase
VQGDPTEGALVVAARKAGLKHEILDARFKRVGEVPFSSERKLMTTIHTDADRKERLLVFTKGAPGVLLARCSQDLVGDEPRALSDARRREILQTNEELASHALRTLGVAARALPADALQHEDADEGLEQELIFLGLIGMIDPPREEAKHAVENDRGDHHRGDDDNDNAERFSETIRVPFAAASFRRELLSTFPRCGPFRFAFRSP